MNAAASAGARTPGKRKFRGSIAWVLLGFVFLWLAAGCQSKLIYFPRPYAAGATAKWEDKTSGVALDFNTSQGSQRAFLQGSLKSPRNLWVVCGGNGTVALDWSEWIQTHAPEEDAWLLVDFPGYGDCKGSPSPSHIRESLETAIPLACRKLGWTQAEAGPRLRFLGHSLGCAACLIAASDCGIQRGVLIAPFTSTMEMSRVVTGLPLGFLVWHRYDNAARLDEISERGPGKVVILHGSTDEVIPLEMSLKLARSHRALVELRAIPGGCHNTIQMEFADDLATALRQVGR